MTVLEPNAEEIQAKYAEILSEFHAALDRLGMPNFAISKVEFVYTPDGRTMYLTTSPCPKGTSPKCVEKPGGRIECSCK